MSDWQERITYDTAPAIRAEHELRYRLAAPLILSCGAWADLGCGNGLAAAVALGGARPERALLLDADEEAVASAAHHLGVTGASAMTGDLCDPQVLARVGETLRELAGSAHAVATCFEVVEHLHSFVPLLRWAKELAEGAGATILLSVPNDAFWSIQNPHHRTVWSEGAFEELRGLLPAEHTLLRQVALSGSAAIGWDAAPEQQELTVQTGGESSVATHYMAVFGPRHAEVEHAAVAVQTDMLEQRRWERERESDIVTAQRMVLEARELTSVQEETIARQQRELQAQTAQFDDWRAYIHELERELGRPLSGEQGQEAPDSQEPPGRAPERSSASGATPPA